MNINVLRILCLLIMVIGILLMTPSHDSIAMYKTTDENGRLRFQIGWIGEIMRGIFVLGCAALIWVMFR